MGAQEPSTRAAAHGAQEAAPVSRTLRLARPAAGRLLWASLLGAGAVAASIGLLASAAWLISRAAEHPGESALGIAIVVVQFCGLSRGIFRYFERLVGHEAAFRALADLRVSFFRRLEPLAPAGLPAFRRGDLVARLVRDVDEQQDVLLRVWPPMVIAALVGPVTVAFVWWLLPAAGLALGACLLLAATAVPWLTGRLARRTEARQAGARGELTTTVVDLIEGAPDLVAYGAVGPQLARVHAADAELSRLAAGSAGTTGVGLGLATLLAGTAMWAGLVLGVAAVHSGRLGGVWLATVALVPLAAFELVAPLPAATQALQRCRRSARRLFGVMDAPVPVADPIEPRPLPAAPRCARDRRRVGPLPGGPGAGRGRRHPLGAARPPGGRGGPQRGREVVAGLRVPAVPPLRARVGPVGGRRAGPVWPATTCAPPWGTWPRTRTSSTPRSPRTCGWGAVTPAGRSCGRPSGGWGCSNGWTASPRAWRPTSARPAAASRAASAAGSSWPAPCWPGSTCWCWTSRPSTSTWPPPTP